MWYSDRTGYRAAAEIRANGVVCSEMPLETGPNVTGSKLNIKKSCIGVHSDQCLSIDFSWTGECSDIFVDISIDGVYRRLKRYVRDPGVSQAKLDRDNISSVWCYEENESKSEVRWSKLYVENIDRHAQPSNMGPHHYTCKIGMIEVVVSVADDSKPSRTRSGRSFEDDRCARPIQLKNDHTWPLATPRKPTHRIAIEPLPQFDSVVQRDARQSLGLCRPGAEPWAVFQFYYGSMESFAKVPSFPMLYNPSWPLGRYVVERKPVFNPPQKRTFDNFISNEAMSWRDMPAPTVMTYLSAHTAPHDLALMRKWDCDWYPDGNMSYIPPYSILRRENAVAYQREQSVVRERAVIPYSARGNNGGDCNLVSSDDSMWDGLSVLEDRELNEKERKLQDYKRKRDELAHIVAEGDKAMRRMSRKRKWNELESQIDCVREEINRLEARRRSHEMRLLDI